MDQDLQRAVVTPTTPDESPPVTDADAADCATVTVYYDGACPLCDAEIALYRRQRGAERVDWIDVSRLTAEQIGPDLTRGEALQRFHVRDAEGHIISGGQAFAALWSALPRFAWLGRLFRRRLLTSLLDRLYDTFLVVRPHLQRVARRRTATERRRPA